MSTGKQSILFAVVSLVVVAIVAIGMWYWCSYGGRAARWASSEDPAVRMQAVRHFTKRSSTLAVNTLRRLADAILRQAAVRAPVNVTCGGDALSPPEVRVFHYTAGDQRYLGLTMVRNRGEADNMKVTVELAAPGLVRELRSGRLLGRVRKFDVELKWPFTHFFSVAQNETAGIDASLPASVKQGGTVDLKYAVKAKAGRPGMRVVRVTVKAPSGKLVRRWEKNLRTADGSGQMKMFLALNDPIGTHTVNLRDIASGASVTKTFAVTPAARLRPQYGLPKYPAVDPPKSATWQAVPRSRAEFRPIQVDEKPIDFSKSLVPNARLLEISKRHKHPAGWHSGAYFPNGRRGPAYPKYVGLAEDKEVLFRGRPTTKITFGDAEGMRLWQFGTNLYLKKVPIGGKTIRVTYHVLRTTGPEAAESRGVWIRFRPWKDGGVKGKFLDAKINAPKNIWMTGKAEFKVDPTLDRVDVQFCGQKTHTFHISGIMIEVVG